MPQPTIYGLVMRSRWAILSLVGLWGIGCSAAVVDADRTVPSSGPGLLPPGPVSSVAPEPATTILAPTSVPVQPTEVDPGSAGGLRHVPIDSVFQPHPPLEQTYHDVKAGDSLSTIAKRYGTTVSAIQQANGLDAKAVLAPGQMLLIPK